MKEQPAGITWCPAITSLQEVIGGKWKIEILFYVALEGVGRFGELKRRLHGVSDSTLSKQLKELVADGFIERIDYGEVPPRVEYRLARRGESFKPIIQAMWDWSEAEFEFTDDQRKKMADYRAWLQERDG